jgi:hypothetical protein
MISALSAPERTASPKVVKISSMASCSTSSASTAQPRSFRVRISSARLMIACQWILRIAVEQMLGTALTTRTPRLALRSEVEGVARRAFPDFD